jgi:hypothetical protein
VELARKGKEREKRENSNDGQDERAFLAHMGKRKMERDDNFQ